MVSRLPPLLISIISRMACWLLRWPVICIFQCLQASCHQAARVLGAVAVAHGSELRTQPNGPVNALGNEVGLSMSDQRWLSSKSCQRKAYLVSFRSETTLGCTAAHRAVAESPEPRAVLGRNALGMPGDCDQARQPLNDTDGGTVKMPCFAALALGFA